MDELENVGNVMAKEKILIVDDEPMIRWTLNEALRGWEYDTVEAGTVAGALASFEADRPAAVLLDINLPDGSGLDALREIKKRQPQAVVIMITANVLLEDTLAALRGGAYDFIGKPVNLNELQVTIRNGIEAGKLRKEVNSIRRSLAREFGFDQIVGESPAMKKMIQLAHKVAESEASSVLLQGESGTGKDLVAKAIHYGSRRSGHPFIAINCAAIPPTLIESVRLRKKYLHAELRGVRYPIFHPQSAGRNDRRLRIEPAQRPDRRRAVHIRHHHIRASSAGNHGLTLT